MWLHPAENSHFGARHLQVDPKFVEDFQIASSIQSLVEENVLLNLSESGAKKYRHASHAARYVVIYACSKSNE